MGNQLNGKEQSLSSLMRDIRGCRPEQAARSSGLLAIRFYLIPVIYVGAHSKVVGFAGVWRVGLGKGAQPAVPDPTRLSGSGHRGAGLAFFDDSNVHG